MKYIIQLGLILCCPLFLTAQMDGIPNRVEKDSLATLYYEEGEIEKAFVLTMELRDLAVKHLDGKDPAYGSYTHILGYLQEDLQAYEKAEAYYLEAKAFFEINELTNNKIYGEVLQSLAYLFYESDRLDAAEKLFLLALKNRKESQGEKSEDYAIALGDLGHLYEKIEDFEEAETYYFQAMKLDKELFGTEHLDYSYVLNNLGVLYFKMHRFEEAEPLLEQAKSIRIKELGAADPECAVSLNNLGALYQDMHLYSKALLAYKQSLDIIEKNFGETHYWFAVVSNNLADVLGKKGNYEKAIELQEAARRIRKKIYGIEHASYSKALNNLGVSYGKLGQFDKAKQMLDEAQLIAYQSVGEGHEAYNSILNNLALLYIDKGVADTALSYVLAGLAANSQNFETLYPNCFERGDQTGALYLPENLAVNWKTMDWSKLESIQPTHAGMMIKLLKKLLISSHLLVNDPTTDSIWGNQQHYIISKAVLKISETLRQDFSGKADKLRFLKDHSLFVEHAIKATIDLNDRKEWAAAFNFAEQNKSMLLAEGFKGNRAQVLGDLPDSLVFLENELQQQKAQLTKEKQAAKTPERRTLVLAKENELHQKRTNFLKSLKGLYPKYHALKYENITAEAKEIQAVLDEKTLLLEYFNTDSTIYLFAITKNSLKLFPLKISKHTLGKKVKDLRKALSNYKFILGDKSKAYQLFTQTARWFYTNLLGKALVDNKLTNLMFVTDGELGHLPFEVFLTEDPMQKEEGYKELPYLIKQYTISYNYSATLWKSKIQESKEKLNSNKQKNNGKILACAALYPAYKKTRQEGNLKNKSNRPLHLIKLRKALNPLPAAQTEIEGLSEFLNGTFLQERATNEAYFKEHAAKYSVIHLAMHGLLNKHTPMLSSLAFTENNDSLEDNFLQAYEIAHLHLNADLVVLSACETGYGKFEQGEGIISLARSFMYAGTPSLVVSLWEVNDYSTAWIMRAFYEYLSQGAKKNAALRQAKLDFLETAEGIAAHPAYWSPFIQLGDVCPLPANIRKSTGGTWKVGVGFLLLGLVLFGVKKKLKQERSIKQEVFRN